MINKVSQVFTAGCLGGLINSLSVWLFGIAGISLAFGVTIAPQLSATWLYPRIVWGGIWGALFLLPIMRNHYISRGLIYSLGPTLVQLLVVFPLKTNAGVFGLGKGALTPLFVVLFNAIWGISAALWLKYADKNST